MNNDWAINCSNHQLFIRYHYGGFPREPTNYPVFDDSRERDRGYNEPRYAGSGPGGGPGAYGERGGYRGRGRPDYGMRGRYTNVWYLTT